MGVLGLGEKACNPTCIDPIYSSIHAEVTWAEDLFTMCFGRSEGILTIGTYDRRFQNGTLFWTRQRANELGYTYDVQDMRIANRTFLDLHVPPSTSMYLSRNTPFPRRSRRTIGTSVCPIVCGGSSSRR